VLLQPLGHLSVQVESTVYRVRWSPPKPIVTCLVTWQPRFAGAWPQRGSRYPPPQMLIDRSAMLVLALGVKSVEGLPLCVDPHMRVVLQHASRQMAANGLQDVICNSHLRKLRDHCMPQVMETESGQTCFAPQRPPSRVPLRQRFRRINLTPSAGRFVTNSPS
jgi:hypothetical protein